MDMKNAVLDYIKSNFKINEVTLKDFPAIPGGTILTDKNGDEMLFYWDIEKQKVLYTIPNK